MNIDIILGIIAGATLIYGLYKGFISQLASVGGLILGIVACRLFNQQAGDLMMELFPSVFTSRTVAVITGCILLYLTVYFAISAFAGLLRKLTHALCIGWADRLCGAAASMFKLVLLLSIVLNIWNLVEPENTVLAGSNVMNGDLKETVMQFAPKIFGIISEQLAAPNC